MKERVTWWVWVHRSGWVVANAAMAALWVSRGRAALLGLDLDATAVRRTELWRCGYRPPVKKKARVRRKR